MLKVWGGKIMIKPKPLSSKNLLRAETIITDDSKEGFTVIPYLDVLQALDLLEQKLDDGLDKFDLPDDHKDEFFSLFQRKMKQCFPIRDEVKR
jgi:hypothetical protein